MRVDVLGVDIMGVYILRQILSEVMVHHLQIMIVSWAVLRLQHHLKNFVNELCRLRRMENPK